MEKEGDMLGTVKVMKSARCTSSKQKEVPGRQRRAFHQQLGPGSPYLRPESRAKNTVIYKT
jgi:hypothetical protein